MAINITEVNDATFEDEVLRAEQLFKRRIASWRIVSVASRAGDLMLSSSPSSTSRSDKSDCAFGQFLE